MFRNKSSYSGGGFLVIVTRFWTFNTGIINE